MNWQFNSEPFVIVSGLFVLLVAVVWLWHLLRKGYSRSVAILLLTIRISLLSLLFLALCDPVILTTVKPSEPLRVTLLNDISSSMDVLDQGDISRHERAEKLCQDLMGDYEGQVTFNRLFFTDQLSDQPKDLLGDNPQMVRQTDLGAVLLALCDYDQLSDSDMLIMLTDGGDQTLTDVTLPATPLYIVAVGTDNPDIPDAKLTRVDFPAIVDVSAETRITAVTEFAGFERDTSSQMQANSYLLLEEFHDNFWVELHRLDIDNDRNITRHEFEVPAVDVAGVRRFRINLVTDGSELTLLNNSREFAIEVRDKQLNILYYAHEIGWEFKAIRNCLADDEAIDLTALFRLAQGGADSQFVVQCSDSDIREILSDGFPETSGELQSFNCIIIDSVAAVSWSGQQAQTLIDYVADGGAVVFLGGELGFAAGGYARSALADLIPFSLSGITKDSFITGRFPVTVPVGGQGNPVVGDLVNYLRSDMPPVIESINISGPLKPAAFELLSAGTSQGSAPLIVISRYGNGQVVAINTNTFWRWGRGDETLRKVFNSLWRQLLKSLADIADPGRILKVQWLQDDFLPGQIIRAVISIAGNYPAGMVHLNASVCQAEKPIDYIISPIDNGGIKYELSFLPEYKGDYFINLEAVLPGVEVQKQVLEKYSHLITVGSGMNEGARLAINIIFLNDLASRSGGVCYRENQTKLLREVLNDKISYKTTRQFRHLVSYNNYFISIFIILIFIELYVRRKLNLI